MAIAREAEPVGSLSEGRQAGLAREDRPAIASNMHPKGSDEDGGHNLTRKGKTPGSFSGGRGNEAGGVGIPSAVGPEIGATPAPAAMGVESAGGVSPWRIFA